MQESFTDAEIALLRPYVSNIERPVFILRNLPEEVIAVLFAYYSRSSDSLRRNLLRLIQNKDVDLESGRQWTEPEGQELAAAREKARKFHEKWVVGYGHASVAEHAVAHIAIEEVSILASKAVEDMRLASFTEKSTRYVVFDEDHFYTPAEIRDSAFAAEYDQVLRHLFRTYLSLMEAVTEQIRTAMPRRAEMSGERYRAAVRAKACDILRYLLPAATRTNLGMTINGRALEHLLTKMFSSPLREVRDLAALVKSEAHTVIPTLIKYADYNPYIAETRQQFERLARELLPAPQRQAEENHVRLVDYPHDAEARLVAAILFGFSRHGYEAVRARVQQMSRQEQERVIDDYLRRRGPHDQPLRALETLTYTFDVLIDFGAYRDIQRHRIATQIVQPLSTTYGYSTPEEVVRFGHQHVYDQAMEMAMGLYERMAEALPHEAEYVLPLAFRRRLLLTCNLRELHHLISLRSSKEGHVSYRRIAQQLFREVEKVHPFLARYIRVDLQEYPMARL